MPTGSKAKYRDKQKRKAEHIEESYEDRGISEGEAERRAWATVNKQSGGGNKKDGSGAKTSAKKKSAARSDSAKKAAATRKRNAKTKSTKKSAS